jgi:hypothetical protein
MAEASIDDRHQVLTYVLLMLLLLFLAWFSSLYEATIAQLLQLLFWYHLRLPVQNFHVKHLKKKLSARLLLLANRDQSLKVRPT